MYTHTGMEQQLMKKGTIDFKEIKEIICGRIWREDREGVNNVMITK